MAEVQRKDSVHLALCDVDEVYLASGKRDSVAKNLPRFPAVAGAKGHRRGGGHAPITLMRWPRWRVRSGLFFFQVYARKRWPTPSPEGRIRGRGQPGSTRRHPGWAHANKRREPKPRVVEMAFQSGAIGEGEEVTCGWTWSIRGMAGDGNDRYSAGLHTTCGSGPCRRDHTAAEYVPKAGGILAFRRGTLADSVAITWTCPLGAEPAASTGGRNGGWTAPHAEALPWASFRFEFPSAGDCRRQAHLGSTGEASPFPECAKGQKRARLAIHR